MAAVKEFSVQEKLTTIISLQKIDSKIDEINKLRGELPMEVKDLEDEIEGYNTRISGLEREIKEVKDLLTKYSKKVEDKAVAVKLTETKEMIKPLCKKSSVNDDNVINLLNYYELVNELKTIHG